MLAALESGGSVVDAATEAMISENTVRAWIRRGRLDPEGRFGAFARAFDARRARLLAPPAGSPPDRLELLRRLDEQSRRGSTRATELLLRALPAKPEPVADEHWRRLMVVEAP